MSARGRFGRLNASDAWNLILEKQGSGRLAIYDMRDQKAYETQHIEGALHLTETGFPEVIKVVSKDTTILVHCYHGLLAQTLRRRRVGAVSS
jgi:rhodanese-related sulfurtransferase